MKRLRYRAHSWAADRFRGVQYPPERDITNEVGRLRWTYPMPLYLRIAFVLLFGATTLFGLGVIAFICFMVWGILR
jgi:hypothetical protein